MDRGPLNHGAAQQCSQLVIVVQPEITLPVSVNRLHPPARQRVLCRPRPDGGSDRRPFAGFAAQQPLRLVQAHVFGPGNVRLRYARGGPGRPAPGRVPPRAVGVPGTGRGPCLRLTATLGEAPVHAWARRFLSPRGATARPRSDPVPSANPAGCPTACRRRPPPPRPCDPWHSPGSTGGRRPAPAGRRRPAAARRNRRG